MYAKWAMPINKKSASKDILNLIAFIVLVILGTLFINAFIFRSFNVNGPSMEKTLYTNDRLIVNKLPVTWDHIRGKEYVPNRGEIIVFKNPHYISGAGEEFIVKRVIAFPSERVTVKNGLVTVYNKENPKGFNPDKAFHGEPGFYTSKIVDTVVPKDELFVMGDHRAGDYSLDSRSGLGTIPYEDIIGPVGIRFFPFDKIRTF